MLIWRGAGQAKAMDFMKEVGGTFDYCQVPRVGTFWISSDHGCHLGLKTVKDLVTTRLPVALPGGLVTRNGGIVPARICGYFYAHVQDSSKKCDKVNLMKNEKTLVTRLVVRYLFSSSLLLFKWIHPFEWWPSKKSAIEKLKGSEKQTSTTGFTVIKVHNETNWNG